MDEPVLGTLTVGETLRLDVHAPIAPNEALLSMYFHGTAIPYTFGMLNEQKVTLLDCYLFGHRSFRHKLEDWGLRGRAVQFGEHIEGSEAKVLRRADFTFPSLNDWTRRSPFLNIDDPPDSGRTTLVHQKLDALTARVDDATIELYPGLRARWGQYDQALVHAERFDVRFDVPMSLQDIEYRYMRPLSYLLALASGSAPQAVTYNVWLNQNSPRERWPVRIAERQGTSDGLIGRHPIVFTLDANRFEEMVSQWFAAVTRFASVCDFVFGEIPGGVEHRINNFFNRASAAEAAHSVLFPRSRKRTEEDRERLLAIISTAPEQHRAWLESKLEYAHVPSYANQLRQLLEYAGAVSRTLAGVDVAGWVKRIGEFRNRIAHSRNIKTIDWDDLSLAASELDGLLRVVLLKQIGFGDDECHRIYAQYWQPSI